jgi:aryl-alcohol dehydrogenase-like predicted oxidoreductase
MEHRELGDSGVEVSAVGFGAWVVGTDWWGDRGEADARAMLEAALESGITYFDTGDVYGHGRSEELVGQVVGEHRNDAVLATKVGYDFYNNPQAGHGELPKEMDPAYLDEALDRSLERLGTDHVEVLQLHNANVAELDGDILGWLDDVRGSRADAIGLALGPSIGWLAEGDRAIEEEFDSVQAVFNLLEQDVGNHFLRTISRTGSATSLIPRVPHSSGLLNEQVTPETELADGDHRAHRPDAWYETGWEKVEALRFLEHHGDRTMGQAAIQWLLSHEAVATVTPTFRSEADIREWAAAPDTPAITTEERERVTELAAENFGIDRFDGMDAADYRSSVGNDDLRAAGLLDDADAATAGR